MQLSLASDRHKTPELRTYRRMTSAEVRALKPNTTILFPSAQDHRVRECRINGGLRTWKTRPQDYRLPVKFGLYEYSAIVPDPADPTLAVFEGGSTYPIVEVAP